ncbi:MAG: aldo/keto reductase [Candidatus Eisenbacteria bacterium]|nr:aldo/keto reductase [Candidatus Eisenbacteria bacterium]
MADDIAATAAGTLDYTKRFEGKIPEDHFRTWGGLHLGSIGMGTYLGPHDADTDTLYEGAVRAALPYGCNWIDTSINYRCMRSERVVGQALEEMIAEGSLRRDEVFLSTKGGYIPFEDEPPPNIRAFIRANYVETGLMEPEDLVGGCHSLAPRFLEDQIERSLENLRVERIDLYYLHNPEVHAAVLREEDFANRLRRAFAVLEEQAAKGRIARYGVSSWDAFRVDLSHPNYLSLARLVEIAREVGGENHHFVSVQIPFNAAMMEAYALNAQEVEGEQLCAIDAAGRFGLLTAASVPLLQGRILSKFPDFLVKGMKDLESNAVRAIQFARSIPGLHTILVGMSRENHVAENLSLARRSPLRERDLYALFGS